MARPTLVSRSVDKNGWRTTTYRLSDRAKARAVFAVCVKDDPGHLTVSKLYRVNISSEFATVDDDAGEVSVYPHDFFVELPLSRTVKTRISDALSL